MDGDAGCDVARAMPMDDPAESSAPPRSQALVWLLLGNRRGDNNQLFALAEALGLPFQAKGLTYTQLRRLRFLRGPRLVSLTRRARELIRPPWPDIVIGIGYGSVPVARYIRRQSGGRTKIVQIGNPRSSIADLDLVITTPQYARAPMPNVLALPFPIGNPAARALPTEQEERWIGGHPHPYRLIAVGGPTKYWQLDRMLLKHAIATARQKSAEDGGTVIGVTSPRTDKATRRLLADCFQGPHCALVTDWPRFPVLLSRSDEIYVTADSVSMLSEAILTGKPVAMIPIVRSIRGAVGAWLQARGLSSSLSPNLSNFWRLLAANDMIGEIESPKATPADDTASVAAAAVLRLLG